LTGKYKPIFQRSTLSASTGSGSPINWEMYFIISLFSITHGKVEVHPATSHTGPEQKYRYNSYSLQPRH